MEFPFKGNFFFVSLNYRYHGSYLKGTGLWIIMEYCSGGSCSDLVCILLYNHNIY